MTYETKIVSNCNGMPPGETWACSSQQPMHSAKPEKLYRVWPGNNKFLCGGRLVLGPDAGSLYLSSFLIGCPAFTFCIRMLIRIREHDPLYGYGVLTAGVILTVSNLMFLYLTCARDPGIIPRNFRPPEEEELEVNTPSMEWAAGKTQHLRLPRTKDVKINGYTIKVKFCDTCKLYRPPRASHCSICNNCVQRFDHHCPWVGQCIGLRNYRYFIFFISSSTLLCIYVFTFSLINILRGRSLLHSVSHDVVSTILVIYCFVAVWFVGGLTIFHFYLMSTNQTTYENFRYRYDKDRNLHNLGVFNNVKQIFFNKIPPSAINFREMVLVEDVMVPETPSYHDGYKEFRRNFDMEVGLKLGKGGSLVVPGGSLQNLDYTGMIEKLAKKVGHQDASFDLVFFNPAQVTQQKGPHVTVLDDLVASKKVQNADISQTAVSTL